MHIGDWVLKNSPSYAIMDIYLREGKVKAMITIVANFSVKPDCVDKFIKLAADCTRSTRKENGNLSPSLPLVMKIKHKNL